MSKLTCLIIEDEPLAAEGLEEFIRQVPTLELVGNCTDALAALELLKKNHVDVLFLDIHLPKLKGLDFLKTLRNPPQVILTTAYHQYALEGYEHNVVDYLLKPFGFPRFLTAVNKLMGSGRRGMGDGGRQTGDGERQLTYGEQQMADGKQQLSGSEQQMTDGEQQFGGSEQQMADGNQQTTGGEKKAAANHQPSTVNRLLSTAHRPYHFFNENKRQVKVFLDEILYVESLKEYVKIVLINGKTVVTRFQLGELETHLKDPNLIRTHRSFLVAKDKIEAYSATEVELAGVKIPIGRSYQERLDF